jgi:hypothetical protein
MIDMEQVRDWVADLTIHDAASSTILPHSAIIAKKRTTPEQALRYMLGRSPKPLYTEYDLTKWILPSYFEAGEYCGVDPCLAIAQMIHETGNLSSWWAERPRRNPAGIGVTGQSQVEQPHPEELKSWAYNPVMNRWYKGVSFSSWQMAVIAHVGRLAAYATKPAERNEAQQNIVNVALRFRLLPAHLHGSAPTLVGLNGTWAYPGKTYAQAIAKIGSAMQRS